MDAVQGAWSTPCILNSELPRSSCERGSGVSQRYSICQQHGKVYSVVSLLAIKNGDNQHFQDNKDLINKTAATAIWVATFASEYKFWVKADLDTFIHPYNMMNYLLHLPATGVYFGFDCIEGCSTEFSQYMSG
jgi:hypothetical protein